MRNQYQRNINTLTAVDEYFRHNRENLLYQFEWKYLKI